METVTVEVPAFWAGVPWQVWLVAGGVVAYPVVGALICRFRNWVDPVTWCAMKEGGGYGTVDEAKMDRLAGTVVFWPFYVLFVVVYAVMTYLVLTPLKWLSGTKMEGK